ncbi:MAG TPA: hypothetical protein VGR76_02140 [Candidatus Angelobacter sp.]|jgi:hypothetical protein|nr:hypothetical protein [Candidatus Angelobacter sp.]
MPNLAISDLQHLNTIDPSGRLLKIVKQLENAHNNMGKQVNASPVGTTSAPPNISAVAAAPFSPGVLHVQIKDNNPVTRGLWYHYEISTTQDFQVGTVLHAGSTPSRDFLIPAGGGPIFARAYSQYTTSAPSQPVSAPAAVDPGGTVRNAFTGAGSGTEGLTSPQPGAGFGFNPDRGSPLPRD